MASALSLCPKLEEVAAYLYQVYIYIHMYCTLEYKYIRWHARTYIVYNNLYNILQYVYVDQKSEMESHENITKVLVVCVCVCVWNMHT